MLDGLKAASRQARSLEHVEHRPWPLPAGRWVMGQTWEQLLFAHWRVPAEELRHRIPSGLEVEEHDGSAWLGLAPFRLTGLRWRGTAPLGEHGKFFSGRHRPAGPASAAPPGSLEWFLAERYCLYARAGSADGRAVGARPEHRAASGGAGDSGVALYRAEIHHTPWVLRPAEAEIELTSIAPFELRGEPICHAAEPQDVVVWPLEPVPARG